MAIDKVREKHERWIKLALMILACIWIASEGWSGFQERRPWLELSRELFFPAIMVLTFLMDFRRTSAFVLIWCLLSLGLWLEANGFKGGIAFYENFDLNGWLYLALWTFYCFLAVSVVILWLRRLTAKTVGS